MRWAVSAGFFKCRHWRGVAGDECRDRGHLALDSRVLAPRQGPIWRDTHAQRRLLNRPGRIGEVLDFFGAEGAIEDGALVVGEPLLEDLVAAELVAPDCGWDVAPEGAGIEVDVEGRVVEGGQDIAESLAIFRRAYEPAPGKNGSFGST